MVGKDMEQPVVLAEDQPMAEPVVWEQRGKEIMAQDRRAALPGVVAVLALLRLA
jgi:hypothetical protein